MDQPGGRKDGTLAAYTSNETGKPEVYIRSFPEPGERTRASQRGGAYPFWSANGNIVYYWTLGGAGGQQGGHESGGSGGFLCGNPI